MHVVGLCGTVCECMCAKVCAVHVSASDVCVCMCASDVQYLYQNTSLAGSYFLLGRTHHVLKSR